MTRPLIPRAKVTISDGQHVEDVIQRGRLTLNGTPAVAVLFRPDPENKGSWAQVDRLTDAKVTENPDGRMSITGVSDELVNVKQVPATQAITTWEVEPIGCQHCY